MVTPLLLKTRVSVDTGGWFGRRAKGVLYLLATPVLDTENQIIHFRDIELDVASRDALFAIVGEAVEPILLAAIESRASFELKPQLDEDLRNKANAAIAGLTSSDLALEGHVEDIRLRRLAVGPAYLQLVATASGRINAAIHAVKSFGPLSVGGKDYSIVVTNRTTDIHISEGQGGIERGRRRVDWVRNNNARSAQLADGP